MNYDAAAARILLSGATDASKARALAELSSKLRRAIGEECPECGSTDCEDNGLTRDVEFRCCACDHRWAPGEAA